MTLCFAVIAHASGDSGHGPDWGNFALRIVNFIIFIGIIWKVAGKKIVGFFCGRRQSIEQELGDLETRRSEAQKQLAEVEQRIANLEVERQAILADFQAQGEHIKSAIIAKAEVSAKQITDQAKRTADNEIKAAIDDMRASMAEEIIDAASKQLQKKLTGEEHEKLIDKYLTKVVLN